MTFLAMVFVLILVQAWDSFDSWQSDDWYRAWQRRVALWSLPPGLKLALTVLVPTALAYMVLDILEPLLFGVLWFGTAVFLLIYSLGRGDYAAQTEHYRRQCVSGDFEGAFLSEVADKGAVDNEEDPASAEEVHDLAQCALLYEGFQRWFPVVFYFMLLGPAAALAYRLLQLCREQSDLDLVERCLHIVDWLPSRLLVATFVVAGDFVGSRDELVGALQDVSRPAKQLLYRVGAAAIGATGGREENFGTWAAQQCEDLEDLLKRCAGAWLIAISLYVVFL